MNRIFLLLTVFMLVSCAGDTSQIASSNAAEGTELDSDCKTLQIQYVLNINEIDKLSAAVSTDMQADTEIYIQLTPLAASMGGENVTSSEQMLAILNSVKTEQEKALESCELMPDRHPAHLTNRGERVAMIKVRNLQHLGSSKQKN